MLTGNSFEHDLKIRHFNSVHTLLEWDWCEDDWK